MTIIQHHILINYTVEEKKLLKYYFNVSDYIFNEPLENNVFGLLVKESISLYALAKVLRLPIDNFQKIYNPYSQIPVIKIGENENEKV